jgi:hypothetical protein
MRRLCSGVEVTIIVIIIMLRFLLRVFKNKTDCSSITDTAGLRVSTKQIKGFSTLNVSNVSTLSPSASCVIAAHSVCKSLDVFNKHNVYLFNPIKLIG